MDALDRNRYAGPAEAELLREQIRLDEEAKAALQSHKQRAAAALRRRLRALEQAQEDADAAQSAHDAVFAREDELDMRISLARGHFHPLRRLPDEVLGLVFIEWMEECPDCNRTDNEEEPKCDHVCTRAAAVCRWWRRVAVSLHQLWRGINIWFDRVRPSSMARLVEYLETHRLRSGMLPLDLHIHGDWEDSATVRSGRLWASLKLCFAQARFVCVRSTTAEFHHHFRDCIDQDAPSLVDFRVEVWLSSHAHHALRFFHSAPLLQRLKMGIGIELSWPLSLSTLPALKDADIDGTDAYGVYDLFRYAPNISSLIIYAVNLDPALSPQGFSVHNDSLKTLDWNTSVVCDASLVQRMHFPSLETAVLGFYDRDEIPDDTITAFLRHPMCTVHTLTLDRLEVAVLEGLRYTRHVTTLAFRYFTETSIPALHALSHHTNDGGWLCPRLCHVTLPAHTAPVNKVPLQDAILAFARARGPGAAAGAHVRESLRSLHFDTELLGNSFPADFKESVANILNSALPSSP